MVLYLLIRSRTGGSRLSGSWTEYSIFILGSRPLLRVLGSVNRAIGTGLSLTDRDHMMSQTPNFESSFSPETKT